MLGAVVLLGGIQVVLPTPQAAILLRRRPTLAMRILVVHLQLVLRATSMARRPNIRAPALVPPPDRIRDGNRDVAAVFGRCGEGGLLARPAPTLAARLQRHADALVQDLLEARTRQLVRELVAHGFEVGLEVGPDRHPQHV
jgi:hypothetical protein